MKTPKLAMIALLSSSLLMACSKGPSEDEAKSVLQSVIASCPYVTIDKFAKTNGVAVGNGNNLYDVIISYTLKTKVDPDAAKYAEEDAKTNGQNSQIRPDLEKQLADIEAARTQNAADFKAAQEKLRQQKSRVSAASSATPPQDISELDAIRAKGIELDTASNKIKYQLNQMDHPGNTHPPTDSLLKCPTIAVMMGTDFSKVETKDFSETIRMVKSDKGWISQ